MIAARIRGGPFASTPASRGGGVYRDELNRAPLAHVDWRYSTVAFRSCRRLAISAWLGIEIEGTP